MSSTTSPFTKTIKQLKNKFTGKHDVGAHLLLARVPRVSRDRHS